ncbi:NAD(P)-dependent oxidoreductase [Streptomyces sp. NPDC051018]|uniref:NAD(P)-dependent oxidoreductase n=1 Tax=Streptomyces sp. NPDC051018 TaxID=3365639 RepID=UPI00378E418A
MSDIIVFGAGGRVGRAVVAEAVTRGRAVTAVVRDPAKYPDLGAGAAGVSVVQGDATDGESVARLAAGHRAAVNASARLDIPSEEFFVGTARALAGGLATAGVGRYLAVGIAATLETSPGVRYMDAPDFPEPYRVFSQGHAAEFEELRRTSGALDWLMVCPPVDLDPEAPRTGRYRTAEGRIIDGGGHISHADLAIALLDEIEGPRHRGIQLAVAGPAAGEV